MDADMKIRNAFVNWMIARLGTWALQLLFLTVRVDLRTALPGVSPYHNPSGKVRYCFCMWHDGIVLALFSLKTFKLSGLISRHQDGSYLSHAVKLLGITPVRGSASRGGAQAAKQLINLPDLNVCITPDGPRGPRRTMKDGIVFLASRTGRPLVPGVLKATRYWTIPGGWSDMVIPKPFAKVLLVTSTPITVPSDASREEISMITDQVQREMDRLNAVGDLLISGDESAADLIDTTNFANTFRSPVPPHKDAA